MMEQGNGTLPSVTWANSSQSSVPTKDVQLVAAGLLFPTVLVGVVGNGLYLWVLGWKMKRTVTTLWFLHLVSCSLLFTLLIPFFIIYILMGFHWALGTIMCKLISACTHLVMFSSVFLLALISLDRYTRTCHRFWSQHHCTVRKAKKLVAGAWLVSLALSAPYLAFQDTSTLGDGRVTCTNYYYISRDQAGDAWKKHVHFTLFMSRFLLGFLLPLCVIAGCYIRMGLTMKEKGLSRSGKPFKVMVAAVVSFFFGWLPYHLYYGLMLYKDGPKSLTVIFQLICVIMFCANVCFTPVLYLFVGQMFQQVFRMSLISLVKAAFYEDLDSDGLGPHSHGQNQRETNCTEV
ncbi:putative G-protein coupled receptor 33 [Pelodiscus sinensis]|uniref:putative G-protein coupled receptor 33 n=1 Tax=Pelodiscus sinensis TaxID=13735 RepID=UPI003F6BAB54